MSRLRREKGKHAEAKIAVAGGPQAAANMAPILRLGAWVQRGSENCLLCDSDLKTLLLPYVKSIKSNNSRGAPRVLLRPVLVEGTALSPLVTCDSRQQTEALFPSCQHKPAKHAQPGVQGPGNSWAHP